MATVWNTQMASDRTILTEQHTISQHHLHELHALSLC